MKKFCLTIIFIAALAFYAEAAATVSGSRVVVVSPSSTTGLEAVFVVEDASNASLTFTAASSSAANRVQWMRFSAMGGGYAEPVNDVTINGSASTVKLTSADMGYIAIDETGRQNAYWVVDYASHFPTFTSFAISADSDCDRVFFTSQGTFDKITYYSVTGVPNQLNRDIQIEYSDLNAVRSGDTDTDDGEETDSEPISELPTWQQYDRIVTLSDIQGSFSVPAPLCDTEFHLVGDRFLKEWGIPIEASSEFYHARHVEAVTRALQSERGNNNEQNTANGSLGGSAPCDITFEAAVTDAAVFTEWQFSLTEDFQDVLYRFSEPVFTYTFTEYGTTYVKFMCADASGECTYESEVYTVSVGESRLLCPNAFSPHNQDGVNDEWKVSYSSLVSYECHIFNRWGKELFSSTNPADGWDGKIGNKFVPAGVYFYVIKAQGADGVKYNLSGDINIVGSKLRPSSGTGEESAPLE